jgi:hypothetical protein
VPHVIAYADAGRRELTPTADREHREAAWDVSADAGLVVITRAGAVYTRRSRSGRRWEVAGLWNDQWGAACFRDVMAATDAACARRDIDARRMLVFPDEDHWILRPRNTRRWYEVCLRFRPRHLAELPFR